MAGASPSRGLFITFEGGEGAGKSTQIKRLAQRLEEEGKTVVSLREPGGTKIGEEIRHTLQHSGDNHAMTPEAELLLMNASRAQLVREVIRPALAEGKFVVCDRFFDSTLAYQGYGRRMNIGAVKQMVDFAVGETRPDLTLLLEISPEVAKQRREARRAKRPDMRDRMEEQSEEFYERVRWGFESIAGSERGRIKRVNAGSSEESVAESIWNLVRRLLS